VVGLLPRLLGISAMNNYEFCADFAKREATGRPDFKVLDYGCGAGQTVALLRQDGIDAYGCETFYEGGDKSAEVPADIRQRIFRMEPGTAPFEDGSFDLIINNQVIEHVADLDGTVRDMTRLLRPGGVCLSLFPHLETWREGHCNVPFLHRFSKDSPLRIYYASAFYGIGYFTDGCSRWQWAKRACDWIDKWCHYRPYREISGTFSAHLSPPLHIESDWIVARRPEARFAPTWLRHLVVRKFAGLVFLTRKQACSAVTG
jgi:SAM-dependent methyltransferase